MLTAEGGVLRSELIQDNVDGQHNQHENEAHEEKALRAGAPWADTVHLTKTKGKQNHLQCSYWLQVLGIIIITFSKEA